MWPIKKTSVVVLVCCCSFLLVETKPYGKSMPADASYGGPMQPSAPAVDSSPWVPISYGSYRQNPQSPPQYQRPDPPQPQPTLDDASPPTAAPVPAALAPMWGAPTDNAPISPPPAPASPVPAPDVPVADPSAIQQIIPTGNLPVETSIWGVQADNAPIPSPPVAAPAPATPLIDTTLPVAPTPPVLVVPSAPLPQNIVPLAGTGNTAGSSIIITIPPSATGPVDSGSVNETWPETPRVVEAADNMPPLPPATFGQFAVPPAG